MGIETLNSIFQVELDTFLGRIHGKVEIDPGPMRLVDLVPTAYELTSILVGRAMRREEKEGRRVSCHPGCGVCCSQMVPLSPPEVFYITEMVDYFDPGRREELVFRFEAIVRELEKRKMIDSLLSPEYSDDPVISIAKEYFSLKMPCPFLAEGSCSIYEHRPVACREYNVTSPAEWCANPYDYKVVKVSMPPPLSAPLAILTAELTELKPRLIPLTLALRWAAGQSDLRHRQWPGVDLFGHFMDAIGRVHRPCPAGQSDR